MNEAIRRVFRGIIRIAAHKAKALGMRCEYICQRQEDGSYSVFLLMTPRGRGTSAASTDS